MSYKIILNFRFLMNLPHPPTSANSPQDIISHIQVVHLIVKSVICYKNQKHFNQFTMSFSFCVIMCYQIFLSPLPLRSVQNYCPSDSVRPAGGYIRWGLIPTDTDLLLATYRTPLKKSLQRVGVIYNAVGAMVIIQ